MKPQRIQRKRVPGWKMPENTVSVTRPGKWGNPFKVPEYTLEQSLKMFRDLLTNINSHTVDAGVKDRFRAMIYDLKELKGKNLACFCPLDQPCHADILLEIANKESTD